MSEPTPETAAPAAVQEAAPTAASEKPKKRWTRFITPVLAILAALVIGGVGGVLVGQNNANRGPSAAGPGGFSPTDGFGAGGPQFGGGPGGGGLTAGTIESIDGDTITIKLSDGSTVTVTTTSDTEVTQTSDAAVGDLSEGDEVTVVGQKDDDGNVAADSISEGQQFPFGNGAPPTQTGGSGATNG